ncbi:Oxysterol-binding protein-like protein 7 [Yarrowia sp. C11]|nr:Oxysterol-binding protein-like protein 7 [Yarrowia sp. C11]
MHHHLNPKALFSGRKESTSPQTQAAAGTGTVSPGRALDPSANVEDVDELDGDGQNIIMGIIAQLRPGADLSRITLPTFILERKSMLERITNSLQHPTYVIEAHATKDPVQRFIQVVKWYHSGWHITPKAVKKPLNPILGEFFTCYWDYDDGSKGYYISEQTSHHPPKSSYFYMIPEHNIRVDGTLAPKSRFLGNSAASLMEGATILKFLDIKDAKGQPEEYEITSPNAYARGILFGRLKYEYCDHSIIKCPALDLTLDLDFKAKGFISGTYNAFEGQIKRISTGEALYDVYGKWDEMIELKNLKTGEKSVLFDVAKAALHPPSVRPIAEQAATESRRLWEPVTDALAKRDHTVATDEKFKIEDQQRTLAKEREEHGIKFLPKLFKPAPAPLDFILYKDLHGTPEEITKEILSIVPILPGQQFTKDFELSGEKKYKLEKSGQAGEAQPTATATAAAPQAGAVPTTPANGQTPLANTSDLHDALPAEEDEFHDAQ